MTGLGDVLHVHAWTGGCLVPVVIVNCDLLR